MLLLVACKLFLNQSEGLVMNVEVHWVSGWPTSSDWPIRLVANQNGYVVAYILLDLWVA